MPGGRRLSRGELIRQREQAQFVVRRAQLSLFAENLDKDPQSYEDPAEFLFHVRGVGGVGKSTLLRQWQEAARDAGAVTAVVDESDVHGVRQALAGLARQLGEQTGPLKEFDKALEQLLREQSVPAQPAPVDGEASVSSRIVTQAALGAASLLPGAGVVTAMTNPDAAAQGLDRLRSGARARAQRRARGSDDASLSRAFVAELERLSQRHLWVVLFFDTWEHTGPYLDEWLLSLLEEKFGPVPANVMVVLAGRDQLAERQWAPLRAQVADVPLEVFTEAETRSLLASRGVSEPGVVEAVLRLSMGLPLLVALLALARPTTAEEVDAGGDVTDAAVERFVQWITDHHQREAVRACALPLQLNEDVFAAAVSRKPRACGSGCADSRSSAVEATSRTTTRWYAPVWSASSAPTRRSAGPRRTSGSPTPMPPGVRRSRRTLPSGNAGDPPDGAGTGWTSRTTVCARTPPATRHRHWSSWCRPRGRTRRCCGSGWRLLNRPRTTPPTRHCSTGRAASGRPWPTTSRPSRVSASC
ncbi:hypothetical protein [Streptomyces sp. NPDC050428]|uniref:hypothetical protein n=1 Tax=Streptomyces sp. NPDC050428 TaxID=3155757 RepID=UPI003445AA41